MSWAIGYAIGAIVSGIIIAKGRGPDAGLALPILASIVWPVALAVDCLIAAVEVADHNAYKRRKRRALEAKEQREREGEE